VGKGRLDSTRYFAWLPLRFPNQLAYVQIQELRTGFCRGEVFSGESEVNTFRVPGAGTALFGKIGMPGNIRNESVFEGAVPPTMTLFLKSFSCRANAGILDALQFPSSKPRLSKSSSVCDGT